LLSILGFNIGAIDVKTAFFSKELVCNKNYMVLVLTIGGAIGLYSTFTTLLEQFLCPYGYSDVSLEIKDKQQPNALYCNVKSSSCFTNFKNNI